MAEKAERVIRSILRGANHFEVLRLAKPHADLLGEPVWEVPEEQVHRAFRKLSLHCHPDKSKHADAPRAFETLKKAKACLLSELERDAYIRNFVKEQKTRWEGKCVARFHMRARRCDPSVRRSREHPSCARAHHDPRTHPRGMLRGASWVSAEESKGSRERVSSMRGSAQSAQSGDVVGAMARRREHAAMMARLNKQRRPRGNERDADDELALSLSSSGDEDGACGGGGSGAARSQTQTSSAAAAAGSIGRTSRPGGGGGATPAVRKRPKFL